MSRNKKQLWNAAERGHGSVVRDCLRENKDILNAENRERYKRTALHLATDGGHLETCEIILSEKPDLDAQDYYGQTPLHIAITKGSIGLCRLLITAGSNLDIKDKDNQSPVDLAVTEGNTDICGLFIAAGVADQTTQTAFTLAAEILFDYMRDMVEKKAGLKSPTPDTNPDHSSDAANEEIQQESDEYHMLEDQELSLENASSGDDDFGAYVDIFRLLLISKADPNTYWDSDSHQTLLNKAADEGYLEPCKLLLIAGADANAVDGMCNTALHVATTSNNEQICKLLLLSGAQVEAKNQMGRTALHLAAHRNCSEICQLLVRHGADVNIEDPGGLSPIHLAVTGGHYESTKVLLESFQVDIGHKYTNNNEGTLLHMASNGGHFKVCELLIHMPWYSNINDVDKDLRTPLHLAALRNHRQTCESLLSYDADITVFDKDNSTCLHHAARGNNEPILNILLMKANELFSDAEKREDLLNLLNATDTNGNTALHLAMKKAEYNVYKPLLDLGANVSIKNQSGMSPFHTAVQCAKSDALEIVCRLLLGHEGSKVDPNKDKDSADNTALHTAAKKDKKEICELLVHKYNADITARNKNGYTPLHYAALSKRAGICRLLLQESNELVNAQGEDGVTPLHFATRRGSDKVCQFLLENGATVNAEDKKGDTPLHYAARQGDDKMCSLLVKKGADALAANKDGEIPDVVWPEATRSAAKTLKRERKKQADAELMKTGERPVEIVKLFLIGHPKAGKTTLNNSMDKDNYTLEETSYNPTPGIAIEQKPLGEVGQFSVWDCAGQMEYHVTHGMFLGVRNSIFLVVYDLCRRVVDTQEERAKQCQLEEIYYWLAFVKAVNASLDQEKPIVALVATHLDVIPENDQDIYRQYAKENIRLAQKTFGDYLAISDNLFILFESANMTDFHNDLEELANSIRETRKIKGLCYKIEQNKDKWVEGVPLLKYSEYCNKVRQLKGMADVNERLITAATIDLHDMGVLYRAHLRKVRMDDVIVLNPNWLFSTIVGRLFAGNNMPTALPKIERKQHYTADEISKLLEVKDVDVKLLMIFMQHLELAVPFDDERYLIPAKLPSDMDSQAWEQDPDPPYSEHYGRRIHCNDDILDIYTPTTFPCLQANFLKKYEHAIPVQNRLKFSDGGMSVLVQMTRDKRGIDVIVRGRGDEERELCYQKLTEAIMMIMTELELHSPGTATKTLYLSSSCLQQYSPLSKDYVEVRSFTEQELLGAEERHSGEVHNPGTLDKHDKVDNIFCLGYDPFFISHLGLHCHSKWILVSTMEQMDEYLDCDDAKAEGTCYRFLATALGLSRLSKLEDDCDRSRSRITPHLIREWYSGGGKERTLGKLRSILNHPGLVGNEQAVEVFDEMLEKNQVKKPYHGVTLTTEVSRIQSELLASRAVLRRYWKKIKEGTRSKKLQAMLQGVITPDEEDEIEQLMESGGLRKVAARLAPLLLESKHEWFEKLLQVLKRDEEQRLKDIAEEMEREYSKVMQEEKCAASQPPV